MCQARRSGDRISFYTTSKSLIRFTSSPPQSNLCVHKDKASFHRILLITSTRLCADEKNEMTRGHPGSLKCAHNEDDDSDTFKIQIKGKPHLKHCPNRRIENCQWNGWWWAEWEAEIGSVFACLCRMSHFIFLFPSSSSPVLLRQASTFKQPPSAPSRIFKLFSLIIVVCSWLLLWWMARLYFECQFQLKFETLELCEYRVESNRLLFRFLGWLPVKEIIIIERIQMEKKNWRVESRHCGSADFTLFSNEKLCN